MNIYFTVKGFLLLHKRSDIFLFNLISNDQIMLVFFSNQVDVYSFGLLLCEMCIRELPDPQMVNTQIRQVTNGALRGLIQRCVERDPEERPP